MSTTKNQQSMAPLLLEVRKHGRYWCIFYVRSGQQIKTAESFRYGHGAKAGFFNLKRDAKEAIDKLLVCGLDWSQSVEYFVGKRQIVERIFKNL